MAYAHSPQESVDSGFSATLDAKTKSFLTKPSESQTSYSQNDADIEEIQISETSDYGYEVHTTEDLSSSTQQRTRYSTGSFKIDYEVDADMCGGSVSVSKSSFDGSMTNSSYTYSRPKAELHAKELFRSSFPNLKRIGKFDEKSLCSRDDNLKEDFDPYKALYAIKFDSFTSSVDLDTFLDESKPTQLKKAHHRVKVETHPKSRPAAKVLFYSGFLFFPAWILGSFYLPSQLNITGEDYLWRRRNRVTCIVFIIFCMVVALAFIIVDPRIFGFSAVAR